MPTTFVVTITKANGYVFRHEVEAHRLVEFLRNYAEVVQLDETLTVSASN